jgi:hypothetical protein
MSQLQKDPATERPKYKISKVYNVPSLKASQVTREKAIYNSINIDETVGISSHFVLGVYFSNHDTGLRQTADQLSTTPLVSPDYPSIFVAMAGC